MGSKPGYALESPVELLQAVWGSLSKEWGRSARKDMERSAGHAGKQQKPGAKEYAPTHPSLHACKGRV